jgi:hypothetical protein
MTIVGKIMTVIVLVLSVCVCGFAGMSYAGRYNYERRLNEAINQAKVAQGNADQFYQEKQRAVSEADGRVAAVEVQVRSLREEVEGYKTQLNTYARRVTDAESRAARAETTATAAQADVVRRQADAEKLRETLATEITRNTVLVKNENAMRDRAVAAEIQVKSLTGRTAALENQYQETLKDLERIKQNAGSANRGSLASASNPPPDNIEGLVRTADPGGLLKLTIGSDSGLAKGHTLEIYRLSPIPSQSKYLGRVRILDVTPHEAVAQPLGRLSDKPQAGDHVATRILGGA